MQHATERVERPGESQEALDGKKNIPPNNDSKNKIMILHMHLCQLRSPRGGRLDGFYFCLSFFFSGLADHALRPGPYMRRLLLLPVT